MHSALEVKEARGYGRGVFAKADIANGELIFEISFDAIIDRRKVHGGPIGHAVKRVISDISDTDLFAIYLMFLQYSRDNFWIPYIDVLPQTFETTMFWTPEELKQLQASKLAEFTERRTKAVETRFTTIFQILFEEYPTLFDEDEYTIDKFKWALSCVWSRQFSLSKDNGGLVPLADMFNMATSDTVATVRPVADEENRIYRLYSESSVKAGSQIFAPYGTFSAMGNGQLLMDYGFLVYPNERNVVLLPPFSLAESEVNYKVKSEFLKANNLDSGFAISRQEYPTELLVAARVVVADRTEAQDLPALLKAKPKYLRNEYEALQKVLSVLETEVWKYTTTQKEDELLLDKATGHTKLAIQLRLEEKQLLNGWAQEFEERKSSLHLAGEEKTDL